MPEIPTQAQVTVYEVAASWWAPWISFSPLQDLAARYFVWKGERKYKRYINFLKIGERYVENPKVRN